MSTAGSSSYLKRVSKATILNAIRESGPLTRSDIARLTKFGWGTITKFTGELVKEGIVSEEHQNSVRGRPSILLKLNSASGFLVGIDLDASGIRVVLTGLESRVLSNTIIDIGPGEDKDTIIEKVFQGVEKVIADAEEADEQNIKGIGIGVSAEVDDKKGLVVFSANLKGWRDVPIKAITEERFGRPCFVTNSTAIVTLGEKTFGVGKGVENLVCISLDVGIGSGIVSHGKLLSTPPGKRVGDIGHMVVSLDGHKCGCGRSGCLEAFAGERALVSQAREMLEKGNESLIAKLVDNKLERITRETIAKAAHEKDDLAIRILREAGKKVAIGIISLIQLYEPDKVVLSGGLSRADGPLVDSIKEEIAKIIPGGRFSLDNLVITQLGEYVGALGATQLAWQGILSNLESLKKSKRKPGSVNNM